MTAQGEATPDLARVECAGWAGCAAPDLILPKIPPPEAPLSIVCQSVAIQGQPRRAAGPAPGPTDVTRKPQVCDAAAGGSLPVARLAGETAQAGGRHRNLPIRSFMISFVPP
jgi:hypothetical protein